ncbi:MAG: RAMP superfamily CRISPR-associated protein [Myxococcota bacterium]|nr:RAMP superfamily CRISPR-associated protein [Myxococcota bacterium]
MTAFRPQSPPPPPNYRGLPDWPSQPAEPLKERAHDRLRVDRVTAVFDVSWVCIDALHVGTGGSCIVDGEEGATLARATLHCRRGDGEVPVIPGASIKGAVRSLAEAIGGGCAEFCGRCVVCGLFGYATALEPYESRVAFGDALHAADSPPTLGTAMLPVAYPPRLEQGRRIYAVPVGMRNGPVPYEVVAPGSRFDGELAVRNVTRSELGLVALCMGLDGTFHLRVGGGKFAGLGRVKCVVRGARVRDAVKRRAERKTGEEAAKFVGECIRAFRPPTQAAEETLRVVREVLGSKQG